MEGKHPLDSMGMELEELRARVEGAQTIALFGHENIDHDAVGSVLGLGLILESIGKSCSYFTTLPPAKSKGFIPGIEKIQTEFDYADYDILLFLDFTPYDRIKKFTLDTPEHTAYFDASYKIIIDHHIDNRVRGNLQIKDIESTSNCGWLYEICSRLRPEYITAEVATHRYMGLLFDSGNFMYGKDANGERDFSIAGGLLAHGARKAWLIQHLFYSNKPSLLQMAQTMLGHAEITGNTLYTYYSINDLQGLDMSDEDTETVQIVLKSMTGYAVYLRLRHMGTYRHGSLRSGYLENGKRISVQKIAIVFGGGGHAYAAGCTMEINTDLSIEDDAKRIVALVNAEAQKQINEITTASA